MPFTRSMPSVHSDIDKILFPEETILKGIDRVARSVVEHFEDLGEFTVVSILKGSCIF